MWVWIVVGPACLVALAAGILFVPVHAVLDVDSQDERKFRFRFTWLLGLIKIGMPAGRRRRARRNRPLLPSWRRVLQPGQGLGRLSQPVKDIFSRIRIRELTVQIRFSTGNPLEAAIVTGLVSAVRPLLRVPAECTIDIDPSFSPSAFFEGRGHLDVSARPIRLIAPLYRFWRAVRLKGKIRNSRSEIRSKQPWLLAAGAMKK